MRAWMVDSRTCRRAHLGESRLGPLRLKVSASVLAAPKAAAASRRLLASHTYNPRQAATARTAERLRRTDIVANTMGRVVGWISGTFVFPHERASVPRQKSGFAARQQQFLMRNRAEGWRPVPSARRRVTLRGGDAKHLKVGNAVVHVGTGTEDRMRSPDPPETTKSPRNAISRAEPHRTIFAEIGVKSMFSGEHVELARHARSKRMSSLRTSSTMQRSVEPRRRTSGHGSKRRSMTIYGRSPGLSQAEAKRCRVVKAFFGR